MKNRTIVELTDEEAASFLSWRKNQDTWDILEKSGVFQITNGRAELHFNYAGQLSSVDTHLMAFRRVKVVMPPLSTDFSKHDVDIKTNTSDTEGT